MTVLENSTKDRNKTFADIISEFGLTQEQIDFIQTYSQKRSTSRFEKQADKLIGNSNLHEDWKYCGYYDSGKFGNGKCSLGHKLRYVHIALNTKTKERITFGIKCVTDFFDLSPLALKLIRQGFNEANNEIKESLDKFIKHGSFKAYNEKYNVVEKLEYVLEHDANILLRSYKDVFEESIIIGGMKGFIKLELPVPYWFENHLNRCYMTLKRRESIEKPKNATYIFPSNDENSSAGTATGAQTLIDVSSGNVINNTQAIRNGKYNAEIVKAESLLADEQFKKAHKKPAKAINDMLTDLLNTGKFVSDKAEAFFIRLINIDWKSLDNLIDQINKKKLSDRNRNFMNSIIANYEKYGLSEKQINIIKKIAKA